MQVWRLPATCRTEGKYFPRVAATSLSQLPINTYSHLKPPDNPATNHHLVWGPGLGRFQGAMGAYYIYIDVQICRYRCACVSNE